MFKSVFVKYVITFTALLVASVLLLLFIVNSVVSQESLQMEMNSVAGVADTCALHLSEMFGQSGASELGGFIRGDNPSGTGAEPTVLRILQVSMTHHSDMTVYVTDASGGFIFCTGYEEGSAPAVGTPLFTDGELAALRGEETLPAASASAAAQAGYSEETSSALPGVFLSEALSDSYKNRVAYAVPVLSAEQAAVGYVLVTSAAEVSGNTVSTTLRSMIVAALWLMLAALIAIYFITERIIGPLREMSKAAKRMAVGQFDVRVPVRGKDEVAELAIAFNQMSQALDNLERMRNSFVANVSHDLRTPMTTIAGFIDGILDGVIPPEQTEHYLRVVSDEVRRLSRLVTALLDVSRLQAGDRKFDMKPFDVCEMGRQILISFEKKINEKQLDVEFLCDEERMFVLADQDAIHQILYNICDNAIKFSREHGQLKMSFSWSAAESSRKRKAVIRIYNEGQGIPSEDLPFIFDRFYKSDKSRSLDKSGVGLGMFISKTIIDAHNETISVASDYGHNCEFTFTLTRTDPPAPKGRGNATQGGNP